MRARRSLVLLLVTIVAVLLPLRPASAHEGEEDIPAVESFATAMALLQVQPDMTDMIEDKIADGLEAEDVAGIDLEAARRAQAAFEDGDDAGALDLLTQATGLTQAEALAMQAEGAVRPSEVALADQLESPGSAGRPGSSAIVALAVGAILAIGFGIYLARRTR